MTLQWILGWWNLIFVAPFAVALLYLFVWTLTGIDFGDADADADVDADIDVDVNADADLHADTDAHLDSDAEVDADADAGTDADADGDQETAGTGHASYPAMALSWLGVGRVPVSLLVIVLLLTWGLTGFVANALLNPREGWHVAGVSIPVALMASLAIARSVVTLIGRFVTLHETSARRRGALVGSVGEAVFGIDQKFGMATVRDPNGDLQQIACRVGVGVEPIPKGERVKLVAYSAGERTFYVRQARAAE